MYPSINNPPTPCITRWGTWLKAAIYYSDNFTEIYNVLNALSDDDAESICKAKALFKNASLKSDLAYIKDNFECICESIIKLEKRGLSLKESLYIIEKVRDDIENLENGIFFEKLNKVLNRNVGIQTLIKIKNIIFLNKSEYSEYINSLSPTELLSFKFAPVTSSDVERIFSIYSTVLCDNRRSFTFENIKRHMIVLCNKHLFQ